MNKAITLLSAFSMALFLGLLVHSWSTPSYAFLPAESPGSMHPVRSQRIVC